MDLEVLRTLGVVPKTFETAELKNWSITFSPMATLVRSEGDSVYGTIAELSRDEVRMLYSKGDLKRYYPVDITVSTKSNERVPVQCYISKSGTGQKPSVEYLQRVIQAAKNLGFPPAYLARAIFLHAESPGTGQDVLRRCLRHIEGPRWNRAVSSIRSSIRYRHLTRLIVPTHT